MSNGNYFLKKLSPDTPIIGLCTEKNEDIAVNAYKNGAINVIHLPFGKREFYYYLLAVLNWLEDKKRMWIHRQWPLVI